MKKHVFKKKIAKKYESVVAEPRCSFLEFINIILSFLANTIQVITL